MSHSYLSERLKIIPDLPGVYTFKDKSGRVIYVGKAINLHNRIRSYFTPSAVISSKINSLVKSTYDFEFFISKSEQEALILELNLIKKYHPRFNIRLKDDKSFPYLKIDLAMRFPRLEVTRRLVQDGARYFGPFANVKSIRRVLGLLRSIFPFRTCNKRIENSQVKACLNYHISRCMAPCIGEVDEESYLDIIQQIIMFMEGRYETVLSKLRQEMKQASARLQYEKALNIRDRINAIEQVIESQRIATTGKSDSDVIAFSQNGDEAWVEILFIRNSTLKGRDNFIIQGASFEDPTRIMSNFIKQFYNSSTYIPSYLFLQYPVDEHNEIEFWLSQKKAGRVRISTPKRGRNKDLVDIVAENARLSVQQRGLKALGTSDALYQAMVELKELLYLDHIPKIIEGYDISDIQGTSAAGSMVVYHEGKPKRNYYRRFKIKTVSVINDYAMIGEVLERRFKRYRECKDTSKPWSELPDVLIIDGGKGHLSVATSTVEKVKIKNIPIIAIAKKHDQLFISGRTDSITSPKNSPALHLIQQIRDEAHRFALGYHRKLHKAKSQYSILNDIPGIGHKRAQLLMKHFGSINKIVDASVVEIASVGGINQRIAERIKLYLYASQI